MKVFMTGGTGFVGTYLSRDLVQAGHTITILSRRAQPPAPSPGRHQLLHRRPHPGGALDGIGARA